MHTRLRVCMRVSVFLSVSAHTCLCVQVHAAEITIANLRMHMYPLEYCIYLMLANVVYFQDDILTGTLTVKENVRLSASLRLPPEMDRREREEKVDEVIEELGLSHVANSLVTTNMYFNSEPSHLMHKYL